MTFTYSKSIRYEKVKKINIRISWKLSRIHVYNTRGSVIWDILSYWTRVEIDLE